MKSNGKRVFFILLVAFASMAEVANAFYDPGLQRWINRDPLGDIGSTPTLTSSIKPSSEVESLVEKNIKSVAEINSLEIAAAIADWSQVNANIFGGIANDAINQADPFGLDSNSYADCIERYRNPITEQLPNAIAERLSSGGSGSGPRVTGWVPPAAHGANAAGNLATGGTGRVGIAGTPPHPTSWQHRVLGGRLGRFLGRAAVGLTVFEGFWDIGLLAGCGIAEAVPD